MSMSELMALVEAEINEAARKHTPMNSLHEGYAVILEGLDEAWGEIKKRTPNEEVVRRELIQTAAMCFRAIYDCL